MNDQIKRRKHFATASFILLVRFHSIWQNTKEKKNNEYP